jgi:hypothetical protein
MRTTLRKFPLAKWPLLVVLVAPCLAASGIALAAPSITITVSPASPTAGQSVTIDVRVSSTTLLRNAGIVDVLPSGFVFGSVSETGSAGNTATCSYRDGPIPTLPPNRTPAQTGSYVRCTLRLLGHETISIKGSFDAAGGMKDTSTLGWLSCSTPIPPDARNCVSSANASANITVAPVTTGTASPIYANFGMNATGGLCPSGSMYECLSSEGAAIMGPNTTNACEPFSPGTTSNPPEAVAQSFTPSANYVLEDVQLPLGYITGNNDVDLWITTDNGGNPGTVLEALSATNSLPQVGPQQSPPVSMIPSVTNPPLNAGTLYWLVLGPGFANSCVEWYAAVNDAATNTDLLFSSQLTAGSLPAASSWVGGFGGTYGYSRSGFEIDGIQQ